MNGSLIDQLIEQGYLKTPEIIDAFRKIKRADFVPAELRKTKGEDFIAEYNAPLPIGYGQTISQPLTVAFMLELLQPGPGQKVLDIGAGSGWQTALLSQIVGPQGYVYAIERIPQLAEFGQENVRKYHYQNVRFLCANGYEGLAAQSPFDRIIAAASSEEAPPAWKKQLKVKGRLVCPIKESIWLIIKQSKNQFKEKEYPGFAFVPLINNLAG